MSKPKKLLGHHPSPKNSPIGPQKPQNDPKKKDNKIKILLSEISVLVFQSTHITSLVFCPVCIISVYIWSLLYFVTFVLCYICILFSVYLVTFDKPKVVSRSQSQKLTTWFSLKSQCPTTPPGKFQRSKIEPYFQNKSC